jgi:hypothetical protein
MASNNPKTGPNLLHSHDRKAIPRQNKLAWVRLNDFNYPRTALYLPIRYRKEAMCEAHDSILGGHNAAHKTYLKISTFCFWPKMRQDIERHQKFCLRCQQRKKLTNKQTPLAPLPIPDRPNIRIHADLFGPMLTADSNKKFVLCITDAFTKYAVVTAIANKEAETVRMPFSRTGLQNLEFRHRYIPTVARHSSTNFRRSFSIYSTFATQKPRQRIRSAMPKWKCLTRQ